MGLYCRGLTRKVRERLGPGADGSFDALGQLAVDTSRGISKESPSGDLIRGKGRFAYFAIKLSFEFKTSGRRVAPAFACRFGESFNFPDR
jgi:hypothetical protein